MLLRSAHSHPDTKMSLFKRRGDITGATPRLLERIYRLTVLWKAVEVEFNSEEYLHFSPYLLQIFQGKWTMYIYAVLE